LRVCDLLPLVNAGAYQRARLSLTPQSNALSSAGTWAYGLPTPEGVDGVTQTLAIYSLDAVGNRMVEGISLTYRLDTVAPALTVTAAISQVLLAAPSPVLTGMVSDSGGLEEVYVRVDPPDGASYRDAVARSGSTPLTTDWNFTPRPTMPGTYTLWLKAYDEAGNTTTAGPFAVTATYTPVQSVHINGMTSAISETLVTLQASYIPSDATEVELLWDDADGYLRGTMGDSAAYVWQEGIYTVVVTATDAGGGSVTDTHTVTVTSVCTPVQSVSISGTTTAISGTAITLNASYLPTDATGAVLLWDNGSTGDSAAYTWPDGVYTVVVTATAACGEPFTTTHTVTVGGNRIYLPLIIRSVQDLAMIKIPARRVTPLHTWGVRQRTRKP
jgi:hypothetical protein